MFIFRMNRSLTVREVVVVAMGAMVVVIMLAVVAIILVVGVLVEVKAVALVVEVVEVVEAVEAEEVLLGKIVWHTVRSNSAQKQAAIVGACPHSLLSHFPHPFLPRPLLPLLPLLLPPQKLTSSLPPRKRSTPPI